ncbi:hypothetical protein NITLEN_20283 [Nitrospira lenta]|uniref:Uncharacterized protein n=1 Tax=Nitrospira lenta TaxID=1436998 RepID=A0A330L4F8_9BACT|nr:hypothetical protein NITLEN_20283 [Nitrospira lenta]
MGGPTATCQRRGQSGPRKLTSHLVRVQQPQSPMDPQLDFHSMGFEPSLCNALHDEADGTAHKYPLHYHPRDVAAPLIWSFERTSFDITKSLTRLS